MKFSVFARWSIMTLVFAIVMASCEKANLFHTVSEGGFFQLESDNDFFDFDDSTDCISIVYPIDISFPDGTVKTINSDAEFDQEIDTWFTNNPNSTNFPSIVFPIQVTGDDGTQQTVSSEEDLCDLFIACFDDWYDDDWGDDVEFDCFEINYPVTLILPDGSQVTANTDDELETAVENYYIANPNDTTGFPTFSYPITVTLADSTLLTINNDAELDALLEDCFGGFFEDCFEIVFPITISMPDGTTQTVNDEEALFTLYDTYYQNNPNATTEPTIVYPIDVVHEDGTTESVATEARLEELYEECFDVICMVGGEDLTTGAQEQAVARLTMQRGK